MYGGECACCGIDQYEFLVFDHIKGGGTQQRRTQFPGNYTKFVSWLLAEKREDMRVLCSNCNTAIAYHGVCPHVPKQHIIQRVHRVLKDIEDGKDVNVRERWKKIVEDPNVPGLAECLRELGPMPEATLDDIPRHIAVRYAARDADATQRIAPFLEEKHAAMELGVVGEIDHAVINMIERMQTVGMPFDIPHFIALGHDMTRRMDDAVYRCWLSSEGYRAINPGSGDQVAALIFDYLKLPIRYMTDGGDRGSTDDKTLEGLRKAHPVVAPMLDYREFAKIRDSYAVTLPRLVSSDGRLRHEIKVTRVASGRLAGRLLTVPTHSDVGKEVRRGFKPPPGHEMGTADLSQIEMGVMAHRSEDPALMKIFWSGEDIHSQTASEMFGLPISKLDPDKHRYPAKQVGFGIINGMTGRGLSEQFALRGVEGYSEKDCDHLIVEWFKIYPGVKAYMGDKATEARRYGYVRDMWGRIRYLPGIHSPDRWAVEEAERQAVNHDIQGSAQGIMKLGMAAVWNDVLPGIWAEGIWCEPLLQVHDELLMEMEEGTGDVVMSMVRDALAGAVKLKVPVKAKYTVGPNWGELSK